MVTAASRPRTHASLVVYKLEHIPGHGNLACCTAATTGVTGVAVQSSPTSGSSPPHIACMSVFICFCRFYRTINAVVILKTTALIIILIN